MARRRSAGHPARPQEQREVHVRVCSRRLSRQPEALGRLHPVQPAHRRPASLPAGSHPGVEHLVQSSGRLPLAADQRTDQSWKSRRSAAEDGRSHPAKPQLRSGRPRLRRAAQADKPTRQSQSRAREGPAVPQVCSGLEVLGQARARFGQHQQSPRLRQERLPALPLRRRPGLRLVHRLRRDEQVRARPRELHQSHQKPSLPAVQQTLDPVHAARRKTRRCAEGRLG